ncbi:MAG TPA: glutathione S-transferase N-terminal domain-containing protein [Alphaproteobacteria bacterium]|nr:glutathione S-transferase N-terminal domain-containing protein [Alphaproteobacteria bacterium]
MRLRHSASSPYVRKVMVVAHETGLEPRIERVPTFVWSPDTDIADDNPIGKVPTLILDDGTALFDSPVICEYLDSLHAGERLFPAAGPARWRALRLQALGDGILDAAVLRRIESRRPASEQSPGWIARQAAAMKRGLDALEREVAGWNGAVTIGQIAAGCACGYLDFRFAADDWCATRPHLAAWYAAFAERPSMRHTVPRE